MSDWVFQQSLSRSNLHQTWSSSVFFHYVYLFNHVDVLLCICSITIDLCQAFYREPDARDDNQLINLHVNEELFSLSHLLLDCVLELLLFFVLNDGIFLYHTADEQEDRKKCGYRRVSDGFAPFLVIPLIEFVADPHRLNQVDDLNYY